MLTFEDNSSFSDFFFFKIDCPGIMSLFQVIIGGFSMKVSASSNSNM